MTNLTPVSEAELQAAIVDLAHLLRWRVAHFRSGQDGSGDWRTAVAADGAGFPDLVLARNRVVIFAELKSEKGRITPAQQAWLDALPNVFVWRPADWFSGAVEAALR